MKGVKTLGSLVGVTNDRIHVEHPFLKLLKPGSEWRRHDGKFAVVVETIIGESSYNPDLLEGSVTVLVEGVPDPFIEGDTAFGSNTKMRLTVGFFTHHFMPLERLSQWERLEQLQDLGP